jgi:rhamnosyltransferase
LSRGDEIAHGATSEQRATAKRESAVCHPDRCFMSAVSVVMATYNGERYLREQLQSLLDQTQVPEEVIISDDGSQDRTLAIINDFSKRAPFLTTILNNQQRLGYAENFLQAAKHAKSKYVAFCDQDDIWYPNKLECSVRELSNTGASLCVHAVRLIDEQSRPCGFHSQGATRDTIFDPLMLPPWGLYLGFTQTFERSLLDIVDPRRRGPDNHIASGLLAHDRWIYLLASAFGKVVALAEPLADYRQHASNQFGKKDTMFDAVRGMLTESYDRLAKHRNISAHRAELFDQLMTQLKDPRSAEASARAQMYWHRLTELYDLRMRLYGSRRFLVRMNCFRQLVAAGAYRDYTHGGLDCKTGPKDLLLGLFQGWHYTYADSSTG